MNNDDRIRVLVTHGYMPYSGPACLNCGCEEYHATYKLNIVSNPATRMIRKAPYLELECLCCTATTEKELPATEVPMRVR